MEIIYLTEIAGLFATAFFAATIIPLSSEALLIFVANHQGSFFIPLAVASIGNILGSLLNYFIGYKGKVWFFKRKNNLDSNIYCRAITYYKKYGLYTLFFAWVPIIGDPLTIVAGIFQANIYYFALIVSVGKISRYAILLYSVNLLI